MVKLKLGDVVVFFGDSITRGFFGSSFIGALKEIIAERKALSDFQSINTGRDGDMIDDLLLRVHTDVIAHHPHWVVIMVGINDIFYDAVMFSGLSAQSPVRNTSVYEHMVKPFIENYKSLLDTLIGEGANVAICTTTGVEGDISIEVREKFALLNDAIRSLAETKRVGFIDVCGAFQAHLARLREEGHATGYSLTVDGVHLSKQGARLVAEQIFTFFFEES